MMFGNVGWGVCSQDRQPVTEGTMYFSANYGEARQKFLEASHAVGGGVESNVHKIISFLNPNMIGTRAKGGASLDNSIP